MSEIDFHERLITALNALADEMDKLNIHLTEANRLQAAANEVKHMELAKPTPASNLPFEIRSNEAVKPGEGYVLNVKTGQGVKIVNLPIEKSKTPTGTRCNRCHEPIKWPHDFQHRQAGDKPLDLNGEPHVCRSLMPQ